MFRDFSQMLDTTLVQDLSGTERMIWKRRILAYQAYSAAMTARSADQDSQEMEYLLRSVREWPSPLWCPKRYAALAVTLKRRLRRKVAH